MGRYEAVIRNRQQWEQEKTQAEQEVKTLFMQFVEGAQNEMHAAGAGAGLRVNEEPAVEGGQLSVDLQVHYPHETFLQPEMIHVSLLRETSGYRFSANMTPFGKVVSTPQEVVDLFFDALLAQNA